MGLSSNARLLTITARLTSNEYESQQISNAKLRLATQSQQASDEYIRALNQQAFAFVTYDSFGNSVNTDLTANVLYQFGDQKNQYVLANANGQALVSQTDAKNFEKCGTLYEFLKCYDLEPKMDSDLKALYEAVDSFILPSGRNGWDDYVNKAMFYYSENPDVVMELKDPYADRVYNASTGSYDWPILQNTDNLTGITTTQFNPYSTWLQNKDIVQNEYIEQRAAFEQKVIDFSNGEDITREEIDLDKETLNNYYKAFSRMVNFGAFLEFQYYDEEERTYQASRGGEALKVFHEYKENLAKLNHELDKRGIDLDEAVTYEDSTKAQWYTNLWYRMNGNSTIKSMSASDNYKVLEKELTSSSTWIRDSLNQGLITIEQASYVNSDKTFPDEDNPLVMQLNGITWATKMFSSCPDIIQKDDTQKLARAEAAYEKKTAEINAKDEKFQRQINLLNTEHNALQTEYDSVKSALEKNISRSFKTFNG